MPRHLTTVIGIAVLAVFALSAAATADDNKHKTPLTEEPAPLEAGDPTAALHQQVPDECTPLTSGLCLETVNTWSCDPELSADAKTRLAPSYSETINNPEPVALAYLDTHCIFERSDRITPATWQRLTGTNPTPDAYIDAAGNTCRNYKNTAGEVVRIECTSPGLQPAPTPTAIPVAAPVPSFAG